MTHISHTATFTVTDPPGRILQDLACPACGQVAPWQAHNRITDNKLRIFCEDCGAFITISLSDAQAREIRLRGMTLGATMEAPR